MVDATPRHANAGGLGIKLKGYLNQHVCHSIQEWTLVKVFDSKIELTESEDENEFSYSTSMELDSAGTRGVMSLGCYEATCILMVSNRSCYSKF